MVEFYWVNYPGFHCKGTFFRLLARSLFACLLLYTFLPQHALGQAGTLDASFDPRGGPDGGDIYDIFTQSDGKILIGGAFTNFDGVSRPHLARLMPDGSLDPSFDPGTNFNNYVGVIKELPGGQILVAGGFTSVAGTDVHYLARLNNDGSLDPGFNAGVGGAISHLKLLPDGRIVVAGGFEFVQDQLRHNIARLLPDGTLDTNFVAGMELNSIGGLDVWPDGRVVLSHQQFWWTVV